MGYLSPTTNSFQFGVKSDKQWLGEEAIIHRDQPFKYSVIAKTKMNVLEIAISDIASKMPRDFILSIEHCVKKRNEWQLERMRKISSVSKILYSQNGEQKAMDDVMGDLAKRHPKATSSAISSIRIREINKKYASRQIQVANET
jgi:ribosomal protein L20A (L18A)